MVDTGQVEAAEPLVHRDAGPSGKRRIGRRGLQLVEQMARDGAPDGQIAKGLKMDPATLRRCRREQPEVQGALDTGRSEMEGELVGILMRKAREGDTVAALFLLKSRFQYDDKAGAPPPSVTIATDKVAQIVVAPRLSDAQFQKLIESSEDVDGDSTD